VGSPGGSRGRAPDATMGKGEGAIDKNMRKELSLEIDGHACAAAHESNVAARRMASTPSTRRQLDGVASTPSTRRQLDGMAATPSPRCQLDRRDASSILTD